MTCTEQGTERLGWILIKRLSAKRLPNLYLVWIVLELSGGRGIFIGGSCLLPHTGEGRVGEGGHLSGCAA